MGQITYQAIDIDEPPGRPLEDWRKVAVQLMVFDQADAEVLAQKGPVVLRWTHVYRLVNETLMQSGALSQEDLACLLDVTITLLYAILGFKINRIKTEESQYLLKKPTSVASEVRVGTTEYEAMVKGG